MNTERFIGLLGADFFTGVPDSRLRPLCDCLMRTYGTDPAHHVIGANEGNCAAIAAGHYLATGRVPVVYMQNSGLGNIINPAASLLGREVYGIPVIFIIGWRGEPGVHDEPQHAFQGKVTLRLLEDMEIEAFVIGRDTAEDEVAGAMENFRKQLAEGRSAAFVIREGALTGGESMRYANESTMLRETAIRRIVRAAGEDPVICTTGKAGRELFEIRESDRAGHARDFLTVGSMGHCSSIALGVALGRPGTRVWCIDGDGAALMHMGALATIGVVAPKNLIHVIINNGAHESVGGMPTAAGKIGLAAAAKACGYPNAVCVEDAAQLDAALEEARARDALSLIEVRCAVGARSNLGRPTTGPRENMKGFMETLENR